MYLNVAPGASSRYPGARGLGAVPLRVPLVFVRRPRIRRPGVGSYSVNADGSLTYANDGVTTYQDPYSGQLTTTPPAPLGFLPSPTGGAPIPINVPPVGAANEQQWYQLLGAAGRLGPPAQPTAPGYTAPPPVQVTVPRGAGLPGGTYATLESQLQEVLQELVGSNPGNNFSNAQVYSLLSDAAQSQCAYLGGYGGCGGDVSGLVSKYAGMFRPAVTVGPASSSSGGYSISSVPVYSAAGAPLPAVAVRAPAGVSVRSGSPTEGATALPFAYSSSPTEGAPAPASSLFSAASSTLTQPVNVAGMAFPVWGLVAAGAAALYFMGGRHK